jgi:hypothetical protein
MAATVRVIYLRPGDEHFDAAQLRRMIMSKMRSSPTLRRLLATSAVASAAAAVVLAIPGSLALAQQEQI